MIIMIMDWREGSGE